MNQTESTPHILNITQLKNLILAGEFSVKVEIEEGVRRRARLLKRPLGDINARGRGEIHYWASWAGLGGSWGGLGSLLGALGPLLGDLGPLLGAQNG